MEAWLEQHDTSPLTGLTLEHMHLFPNLLVRGLCRKFALAQAELAHGGRAAAVARAAGEVNLDVEALVELMHRERRDEGHGAEDALGGQ